MEKEELLLIFGQNDYGNDKSFIDELIMMATTSYPIELFDRKDCFYDFHNTRDPQKEIIDPIKHWFEKIKIGNLE